ncbi:DUF1007 family protein [Sulfitobacter pacificus]|nr:DUF1007 family protein [Sulfitobacter pacificus]
MRHVLAFAFTLLSAAPLAAHPHIFVDTGLDLQFDETGRLREVRVTWAYDEFYSLLITEDRGLDPDFDGVLTEAEQADLQGFDMQWTEGFNGDLVITQDGRNLTLSAPMQATAVYENARITTTHVRQVIQDQAAGAPIEIKPYDPTYYSAYDVTLPVRIEGNAACAKSFDVPDVQAQIQKLSDQLAAMDEMSDENTPDIGILLATTVRVTCDLS